MGFYEACAMVIAHCPNAYAKAYARAGQLLPHDNSEAAVNARKAQALYIRSNLGGWRGDLAKRTKEALKAI